MVQKEQRQRIKTWILLVQLDDEKVYQVLLSDVQETGIKSILESLPGNLQLLSKPLDLIIEKPLEKK